MSLEEAMKIAILGPTMNMLSYTTSRLLEEAKKEFEAELIPLIDIKLKVGNGMDIVHDKKSLKQFDYILPRIDSKRAAIGYPVIRFLDDLGVRKPYPAETVLIAHNKFLTLEELVKNGIPVPETYLTGSKTAAKDILGRQRLPVILKLLSSFGGQGVMILESKDAVHTAIDTMTTLKQEILIEEYIPNPGEDIRGIVAGEEIVASYKRIASPGEKKANLYSGGRPSVFKLTSEMEEIVFRAAEAVKSKICAVDMVQGKDGIRVIEVNINPGLKGIEKATDINVAQRIISFVKNEIKR